MTDNGEQSYLLTVRDVVPETADAASVVFDLPDELADTFGFRPGQFLTLGIPSERTGLVPRCYSLCVPPGEPLTVTVKRTEGGYASNWVNDRLRPGDTVRVLPPEGTFTPRSLDDDLLLFAAGSGITPVMSIVRAALASGSGRVVLFYANRDSASTIFGSALRELAAAHPSRLLLVDWHDDVHGLPTTELVRDFAEPYVEAGYDTFTCGPTPFMAVVQAALKGLGVPRARRHQERFISLDGNPFGDVEEVRRAQAEMAAADESR